MKKVFLILAATLASAAAVAGPAVVYLNSSAKGLGTGESWSDACKSFPTAVRLAVAKTNAEIWVAGDFPAPKANVAIELKGSLTVRGGFRGTEKTPEERAAGAVSAFDGGDRFDFLTVMSPRKSAKTWERLPCDVTVERVDVRHAKTRAIYCHDWLGALTVRDSSFLANGCGAEDRFGRAIRIERVDTKARTSTLAISNCRFEGNTGRTEKQVNGDRDAFGVAVSAHFMREVTVEGSSFVTNGVPFTVGRHGFGKWDHQGGGTTGSALGADGRLVARNCRFIGNFGRLNGRNGAGGAVNVCGACDGSVIENCTFVGNHDGYIAWDGFNGGALVIDADAPTNRVRVTGSTFAYNLNNSPTGGGGLSVAKGAVEVTDCIFYGNCRRPDAQSGDDIAADAGASVRVSRSSLTGLSRLQVSGDVRLADDVAAGDPGLVSPRAAAVKLMVRDDDRVYWIPKEETAAPVCALDASLKPGASLRAFSAQAAAERPKPTGVTAGLLKRLASEKTVTLDAGTYYLDESLLLGSNVSDRVIRAAPGAKVVLSGGCRVTGWKKEADGFWSASVPWVTDRIEGFHHIVVNGVNRERGKAPNEGYFKCVDRRAPEYAGVDWMSWEYSSHKYRIAIEPKDAHPDWDIAGAEPIVYHFWNDSHAIADSFEVDKDGLAWLKLRKCVRLSPCKGLWRLENARVVCDLPGEWYFDYGARRLHYRPADGEDMATAEVYVPRLANLVRLEGARNVRFEGLAFVDARADLAQDDRNDQQAAYSTDVAIRLAHARDCVFERCRVTRTDGYAFGVFDGSRGTRIRRCSMEHVGAGGVHVTGGGCGWAFCTLIGEKFLTESLPDPKSIVSDTEISDCTIADYGRVFAAGVGVIARYAERTAIVHNDIHGGYYSAVSVGWSWGYHHTGLGQNTISFNHIYDIGRGVLSDMGAIYTLGVQPGTVIANNVVHDIDALVYGGNGLYNDEGSTGVTLENNLVYDTKYACYTLHYGHEIVVRNNIFAGSSNEQFSLALKEDLSSLAFYNNIIWWKKGFLHSGAWADTRAYDFRASGNPEEKPVKRTQGCLVDYNLYFSPGRAVTNVAFGADYAYFSNGGWPTYKGKGSFEKWQKENKKDVHSLYADPLFVDAEKKDFRLKPDSPAYRLGFKPIDFSKVGPR